MKKVFLMLLIGLFVSFVYGQTKTEVKSTDLKKEISDNVAKDFTSYKIEKSFKSDAGGVITYEVMISNAKEKKTLVYDKDGKFVKKIEPLKKNDIKKDVMKKDDAKKENMKKEDVKKDAVKKDETKKDAAKFYYTCTMHPDVHADKPGKCPKCGMDLVKKEVENKKAELK
jgi:hypothetical protein